MNKNKVYSLCIGIHKLRQLKEKKSTVVSHKCSPHWENFYNKNLEKVRFFDQMLIEHGIFIVKAKKKMTQAGEHIIRIEVEKEIL